MRLSTISRFLLQLRSHSFLTHPKKQVFLTLLSNFNSVIFSIFQDKLIPTYAILTPYQEIYHITKPYPNHISPTMQYLSAYLALLAATSIAALPLNINLGAYSPALVVGDGEISFGGEENAEALLNTLAGASAGVEGAAAGLQRAGEQTPAAEIVSPATTPVAPEASASPSPVPSSLPSGAFGIGRKVVEPREPNNADRGVEKREEDSPIEKRDLAGFNAALNFATGALKTSPGVELGTGEGGSGVGIIVKPGVDSGVAATPATAAPAGEKRDAPAVTLLKIRSLGDQSGI